MTYQSGTHIHCYSHAQKYISMAPLLLQCDNTTLELCNKDIQAADRTT